MHALPPTRSAALARIAAVQPAAYARTRNHLTGAVTGLSPYLTHGLVTLPEVLAGAVAKGRLDVQHKLVFELGWREYFRHVWALQGEGILRSLHAGPRAEAGDATAVPDDVLEARTGVPAIDEAVRTLYASGTLHNHARMWLASYLVHLRHVHWRAGADWLVAHLLDGDLGSNHLSWQWVAGTASHKPYLFNADNVARYAPPAWHSAGTAIDQPYEALERIARGVPPVAGAAGGPGLVPPPLFATPPPGLPLRAPAAADTRHWAGRRLWLVHPWGLRPPPDTPGVPWLCVGVYPAEHHARWPWPEVRWRWVDAAMAAVAPERWWLDAPALAAMREAMDTAAEVHTVHDPHVAPWLARLGPRLRVAPAPALFPPVARPCRSFSQWWTQATRGLRDAGALL